jgi:diguanylate cyclase (GGDEF)-like protein/PAS domain S-box-containing protein
LKSRLFDSNTLFTADEAVEFISNILESSTEYSIIAKALDGTILLWNEGARRLYGYEAEEVVGIMNGSSLHAQEEVQNGKPTEILEAVLKNGKWEGTLRRVRKNGEEFLARVVVTPRMNSSGKAVGILLISKDISEEIRMTKQLESSNNHLREEIIQRQTAEIALLKSNQELIARSAEMEQTATQMRQLAEMSDLLQSCGSSEEARQVTEKALTKFFPVEAGTIYLISKSGGSLEAFARWNNANLVLAESFEPHECWALRRGRPHIITNNGAALRCSHMKDEKAAVSICTPMLGQGQTLGVFHLEGRGIDTSAPSSRAENRQSLATGVADIIALAISNVRLREALKDQTIHDPLTGLYNRRYLEDTLHREISRARRSGASVGFIMFDIDNFKQFNDTYGHPLGDQLLRALGNYLKALVRPEDIPCRYGGEEFTLVMPGASREIARERAEKARRGFQNLRLSDTLGIGRVVEAVTISAGVAVFPENGDGANEVLRAADQALYIAKRGGKDRVVIATGNSKAGVQEHMTEV